MAKMTNSVKPTPFQSASAPRQTAEKRVEIRDALAAKLLRAKHDYRPPFVRAERKKPAKPAVMVAYDFETTNIKKGTPRPLYFTACGKDFAIETPIKDMEHLTKLLTTQLLTPENEGVKYVAWNANRFDSYFIAAALIYEPRFRLRPYMTKSKTLRGLRVELALNDDGEEIPEKNAPAWEFLDGIAMLGLAGVSLDKLLANFAPEYRKLSGTIDFEGGEQFNPKNAKHRAYAWRDSEGLYHAMNRAQSIMIERFNQPLTVTMGGACIKIFAAHIPPDVKITALIPDVEEITRAYVMRGGYCFCVRRYEGPVWKYDLNQAYAAAMREADLPASDAVKLAISPRRVSGCFIARIKAYKHNNTVPFYYRTIINGRVRSTFSDDHIHDTWITSIEYRQLLAEGWQIQDLEAWAWGARFNMKDYVDKLERLRTTCEGGPSGPIGTMIKATGNHSYGKTVEKIEPIEYVIAAECPPDCLPFYGDGSEPLEHIFYRMDDDRKPKAYHQPHVGAFITAHVRMLIRRAALLNPRAWLYADTDCVMFDCDMAPQLDIDPKRYGAWKIEDEGTHYQVIAKKVYAQTEAIPLSEFIGPPNPKHKRSAKGLNVRKLSPQDFARWIDGQPPAQDQIQINNFLAVLCGAEMFREQHRRGTAIEGKR